MIIFSYIVRLIVVCLHSCRIPVNRFWNLYKFFFRTDFLRVCLRFVFLNPLYRVLINLFILSYVYFPRLWVHFGCHCDVIRVINTFARANTCCPRPTSLRVQGVVKLLDTRRPLPNFQSRMGVCTTCVCIYVSMCMYVCDSVCTRIRRSAYKRTGEKLEGGNMRSINRAMRTDGGRGGR